MLQCSILLSVAQHRTAQHLHGKQELRGKLNDETSYVLAVGEMNHHNVKNLAVVQSGSAGGFFGNTTKTVGCVGVTTCLANEFEVRNALAEVTTVVAGQPVVLFC